jgi:hypothetical protein
MAPLQGDPLEKERKICLIKMDGILRGGKLSYKRGLPGLDPEISPGFAKRKEKFMAGHHAAKFLISIG